MLLIGTFSDFSVERFYLLFQNGGSTQTKKFKDVLESDMGNPGRLFYVKIKQCQI